jgi:hypothetical protein
MSDPSGLGAEFARALGAKDFARVKELMHPELDFRGMTPNRAWEATGPDALVAEVLTTWFDDEDVIATVDRVETDAFADRLRVGYRFTGRNAEGPFVVEQQAYLSERDGRIGWLRVLCSGFRPA